MIRADQPTCFPASVLVAVSSKDNGTLLDRTLNERHAPTVVANRQVFCIQNGVAYDDVVYQTIVYGDAQTYITIADVNKHDTTQYHDGVEADALFTKETGVGLLLPVADCVATVFYDPVKHFLALAHLGRHSTFAGLATHIVEYFVQHGSASQDIVIWMSPSAQKSSYHLKWFEHEDAPEWHGYFTKTPDGYLIDLQGYNRAQCVRSGITSKNVYLSTVDTATDPNYFSHSSGDTGGRIAVLAMMR